ncbi:GDP-6-deoxy-D-mannose reductase [compost metagenome]
MPTIVARTFNLLGPGQTAGVSARLIRQVLQIEQGLIPPFLVMGNQTIQRDFLDVRDAVEAYWSLIQLIPIPAGEIYNVCRGQAHSIETLVNILQKITRVPFQVRMDESLLRPGEPPIIQGDNTRLVRATGWKPNFSLKQSLLDAWKELRNQC